MGSGSMGKLGHAWVGVWVGTWPSMNGGGDEDGGGFINDVLYLAVGVGGRRIGEFEPDHWGSPGVVLEMAR